MSNESHQVFHENSAQANETLKAKFIEFGTKLHECLQNPKVLTEVYLILRKTDPQNDDAKEYQVLASCYDVEHMRSLLAATLREAILCEIHQARAENRESAEAGKDVEHGKLLDACYAARIGRDTLGYAHRLIKDFQHRANLEDLDGLNQLCEHIVKTSAAFIKLLPRACTEKNDCEYGPRKCPLAEKLE